MPSVEGRERNYRSHASSSLGLAAHAVLAERRKWENPPEPRSEEWTTLSPAHGQSEQRLESSSSRVRPLPPLLFLRGEVWPPNSASGTPAPVHFPRLRPGPNHNTLLRMDHAVDPHSVDP